MTKRFGFTLPREVAEQFYRAYPNQGDRSQLLRSYVLKLIQKSKMLGGQITLDRLIEEDEER